MYGSTHWLVPHRLRLELCITEKIHYILEAIIRDVEGGHVAWPGLTWQCVWRIKKPPRGL